MLPPYEPPRPTLIDGLQCVSRALAAFQADESFTEGIKRCFKKVGLVPASAAGFLRYPDSHKAARPNLLPPPKEIEFSAGDIIDNFVFEKLVADVFHNVRLDEGRKAEEGSGGAVAGSAADSGEGSGGGEWVWQEL